MSNNMISGHQDVKQYNRSNMSTNFGLLNFLSRHYRDINLLKISRLICLLIFLSN
jgi:hypothetical protein